MTKPIPAVTNHRATKPKGSRKSMTVDEALEFAETTLKDGKSIQAVKALAAEVKRLRGVEVSSQTVTSGFYRGPFACTAVSIPGIDTAHW